MLTETIKYILPQLLREHQFFSFIETSTSNGDTAAWAADLFDNVYTIETRLSKHNHAALKYGDIYNVDFLPGNPRTLLPLILEGLTEPCVFWLNAQLDNELNVIAKHSWKHKLAHLILIDNINMDLLVEVLTEADSMVGSYRYYICQDTLILYPDYMDELVESIVAV